MRKSFGLTILAAVTLLCAIGCGPSTLKDRLAGLPGATVVEIEADSPFVEAYDLRLVQPLDHGDPDAGSFVQRVLIEHRGSDRPVVLVTEGYELGDNQAAELAEILGANQVRMEHRYVGDSVPEELDWQHLNISQSAEDAHRLVSMLKSIYPGPWVSTGWSKGGQAAVIYRFFYPDDVIATVAYDAPLPRALEDPRIDAHFETVGTPECRERLRLFQRAVLEAKPQLLPLFRWYAEGKDWGLSVGEELVFDYAVLEFPFSFWQYTQADCDAVPGPDAKPEILLAKLLEVVSAGWFADASLDSPSFHQFCTELGFYGYDEADFADLLSAEDYPLCFYAPNWEEDRYDPFLMEKLDSWIRSDSERMMSVYGGVDPWSAPAMPVGEGRDHIQFWARDGNHFTFIRTLSEADQLKARKTLATWLGMPLEEVGE